MSLTILAFDLGGTGLRAGLVDESGELVALAAGRTPFASAPDAPEADPDGWWAGLRALADELAASHPVAFQMVAAVAIGGATRTQVWLDAEGRTLRPATTWADARSAGLADELAALLPKDHPETALVNPFHPVARLHWLKRTEPERFARLAHVLDPKDFLNFRLTGQATTDAVSLARLIASARRRGEASLLDAVGAPSALLPQVLAPTDVCGTVTPGLPGVLAGLAGRPVLAMAHDTWAAVVGLGALREGHGYNLSGTTEIFGGFDARPLSAPGLMSVDWGQGLTQLGGPSLCGGGTIAWALGFLGSTDGRPQSVGPALDALLAAGDEAGGAALLFLPWLAGERVPHWNENLRAAFLGLSSEHGPADAARAALEGVAFVNRSVLDRIETARGAPLTEIRFGGGGAANPLWAQIKADVLQRPVVTAATPEAGLSGAGIAALHALGRHATLGEAQAKLARPLRRFEPGNGTARLQALYALHAEAASLLAPLSTKLAKLRASG